MPARSSHHTTREPIGRSSLGVVAAVFVAVFAILQAAVMFVANAGLLDGLMLGTASISERLIATIGIPITRVGTDLHLSNHILRIDPDCTGVSLAVLYLSAVIAYPLSMRSRLMALAIGIPAIAVANQVRLLGVALASQYLDARGFAFVHDYLFMVGMVLVVVALWATWLETARVRAVAP